MITLYHQLGWRYKWNIESITQDGAGDGAILAPRYMSPDAVDGFSRPVKRTAILDPQFFVPNSRQGKLPTWPFFPEVVADGFLTGEFQEHSSATARFCLEYQLGQPFSHVVAPTRYHHASIDTYVESQATLFVDPFVSAYEQVNTQRPLLLQLILSDAMLKDEGFRGAVLNWVTGLEPVSGVYLIPHHPRRRKQVHDIDYLVALLNFVADLRANEMEVIVGYLNTESVLLLAADPTGVSMGSYENLRMFSLRAFENQDQEQRLGPLARVYVSRLLQWVTHEYIGAIVRATREGTDFFDESEYRITMFSPSYNWHFSRPEPYKHFFGVFSRQIRRLSRVPLSDRPAAIREECVRARNEYERLDAAGIVFEPDSGGDHVAYWLTALNLFLRQRGISG